MRILHCCLASFYIDNFGYQENILPKMHKLQGYNVKIIASTETYISNKKLGFVSPSNYFNEDGIPVSRLPYPTYLPKYIARKLRFYSGLYDKISEFSPDIIFLHGPQFGSLKTVAKYAKKNKNVTIYVDSHSDWINSAKGWVSKYLLHKVFYRWCVEQIKPYVEIFYGTLPVRNRFMQEMYKIPSSKIKLLEFGADDSFYDISQKDEISSNVREKLNITDKFVLISGGKIDIRKNIDLLVRVMNNLTSKRIILLLFGEFDDEMNYLKKEIKDSTNIIYLGWLGQEEIYKMFFAADLGVFPGTHSVLWEQACGVGLPCLFKEWVDIDHLQLGGNCIFIKNINEEKIRSKIINLYENQTTFRTMKSIAEKKGVPYFSYSTIAKRAIDLKNE